MELPVASVVADRLEAGLYRFGGRVAVGRAIGGETVTMVAPGPLRLERCFPVPRPESSATAEDELPFPTEVEESGLRSRARSELTDCGTRWRLWLAVTNVANAAVTAEFPKRCMVTRLVAFREGEFGEPVWRATHAGPCEETRRTGFPLQPGETFKPFSWEDNVQVETILGDSLEVGFYRFGSERVEVDGEIGGNAARMIGPVPLRLERSP